MAETSQTTTVQTSAQGSDGDKFRFNIAMWVVIFAFGGIGILGLTAIIVAAAPAIYYLRTGDKTVPLDQSFNNIKDILGILLPVISAWAGTVFAFYFSRENFETATKASAALVAQLSSEEKLKSIVVKDVMIKIEDADTLILDKDPALITLKNDILKDILDENRRERLPILDKDGHIKYMVHRSLIDKFIARKAGEPGVEVDKLSLADLLADPGSKKMMSKSFCTIPPSQNLGYAKAEMEKILNCSDTFITEDGTTNSKVIGWITDVIVGQQAYVK